MSFLSNFLQDLATSEAPLTNAAQLAPVKDEPSTPPPDMPPPAASGTPTTDNNAAAAEPSTPKHRRNKATKNDDYEPSPAFDSLSRAAKNKFRAIVRKRQATRSSETHMWYCRERCDWPFASKAERSAHERRCAVGRARFSSRQEFEDKIAGRSNEDVMSEWEALMQESARKFSGGAEAAVADQGGGAAGGGKEGEGEAREKEQQKQRRAKENQAPGGLQHAGGKDEALRKEESSRGVFSTEFMLKYGAMQIEEKDARKATFAEFMAQYGAADVEQAEPEVQVKVEDDGNGNGGIPLGENWWVPQ